MWASSHHAWNAYSELTYIYELKTVAGSKHGPGHEEKEGRACRIGAATTVGALELASGRRSASRSVDGLGQQTTVQSASFPTFPNVESPAFRTLHSKFPACSACLVFSRCPAFRCPALFRPTQYCPRINYLFSTNPTPMFSLANRVQKLSNHMLTASSVITVVVVLVSVVQLYLAGAHNISSTAIENVRASALLKHLRSFGAAGRPKENSRIVFDLSADLTPLFHWNTKQVFVYLTAEYDGRKEGQSNRVTYWDKILTSPKDAVLDMRNVRAKYSVWDTEASFRGRNATLRLEWSVQPYLGAFISGETTTEVPLTFASVKKK